MFGQAVGVQREFSGMMSKPWRMVTLGAGAWITFALGSVPVHRFSILDLTCLFVITGCLQTIAVRLKRIMAALRAKSAIH
jgi:hypothetical protein